MKFTKLIIPAATLAVAFSAGLGYHTLTTHAASISVITAGTKKVQIVSQPIPKPSASPTIAPVVPSPESSGTHAVTERAATGTDEPPATIQPTPSTTPTPKPTPTPTPDCNPNHLYPPAQCPTNSQITIVQVH